MAIFRFILPSDEGRVGRGVEQMESRLQSRTCPPLKRGLRTTPPPTPPQLRRGGMVDG